MPIESNILLGTGLEPVFPIWEFRQNSSRKPWLIPGYGLASLASIRVNYPRHFVDAYSTLIF